MEEDNESEVCLLGRTMVSSQSKEQVCLAKYESSDFAGSYHWFIESGCTSHLTFDRRAFTNYTSIPKSSVDLGADSRAEIVGQGDVVLRILVRGKSVKCTIKNVKHVPTLRYQLLSVYTMGKLGVMTTFDDKGCVLRNKATSKAMAFGTVVNGLYAFNVDTTKKTPGIALVANLSLWHHRLAHVNVSGIKSMASRGVVKGVVLKSDNTEHICDGCILGKSHRTPIPRQSHSRAKNVLDLVHSDVLGPLEVDSVGGSKYFISFIDDHSNWVTVYTMRKKSEALNRFIQFKQYAETHTNRKLVKLHVHETHGSDSAMMKLKVLRSDNGGEYLSNKFKQYLDDNGIHHELSVTYTPQQNGVAERMNRTLLDLVRSMLYHKGIDKRFWAEALATAVYARNRVTSRELPEKLIPYHI